MNRPVAITGFALWSAAGVVVNRAPEYPGPSQPGAGLAAWPDAPPLSRAHPQARRPAPQAVALVQLAHALWSERSGAPGAGTAPSREGMGLVLGTAAGSRTEDLAFQAGVRERGPGFGSPGTFVYTLSSAAAAEASLALGARGGLTTLSAGSVSGWAALVQGVARVARGQCEICLVGSMESSPQGSEAGSAFIGLCLLEPQGPRQVSGQLGFDPARAAPPGEGPLPDWARLGKAVFSSGTTDLSATSPEGHWVQLRLC